MVAPEHFLSLLLAVCLMAMVAQRVRLSAPIVFVVGGVLMGLVPDAPKITVPPQWMLLIFLPPLLMEAAFFTSLRDFQKNLRVILQLAVGLVAFTTVSVAAVGFFYIPEFTWALGFVLGAIISPPDAVAATSVIRAQRVPKRLVSILEGESLINDATGLVLYSFAVAAVVSGSFSLPLATANFVWMACCGLVLGVSLGYAFIKQFHRIKDTAIEVLATLLLPYGAYLLAESVHSSGVIAVVATGLTVGWFAPEVFQPRFRMPAEAVWKIFTFLLNGVVFLLIGLELPAIGERLFDGNVAQLLCYAGLICFVTIITRFIWVYLVGYGTRFLFPSIRKHDPYPA